MRFLVGVVTAALLLAGCTSGGGASPSASTTPSAPISVSTSPGPSPSRTGPLTTGPGVRPGEKPPLLYPEATKRDSAGALAFAAYYVRAMDWSIATSDPFLLERTSAARCDACQRLIHHIRALASEGGHLTGGRIRIVAGGVTSSHTLVPAEQVVRMQTEQGPLSIVRADASPSPETTRTQSVISYIYLAWSDRGWQVVGDFGP